MPALNATVSRVRYSPLQRIKLGLAGPSIVTLSPTIVESSTITMASAPWGMGAPVIILQASPAFTAGISSEPAWLVPTILSMAPSSLQSASLTAQPSIAELSNLGSSTIDIRSSKRVRPDAVINGIVSCSLTRVSWLASSIARCRETPTSMVTEKRWS